MSSGALYYGSLILCISLSSYYKKITDINVKRNYGTGLGILLACLICGHYIYHSILIVWGNIIIIKCCERRYGGLNKNGGEESPLASRPREIQFGHNIIVVGVAYIVIEWATYYCSMHQLSLAYTWLYLTYLHYNVLDNYVIWFFQSLALKLVGLAFEIYANDTKNETRGASSSRLQIGDDALSSEPTAVDIISYAYFFIGIHRGPYYRWKIFEDHFIEPFGTLGDCWIITEQKLKKACVYGIAYFVLRMKYSDELYKDPIFYQTYGADFRFLYNIPILLMYLLHHEILMMFCTSVFTEASFGIYPAKCQAIPGYGPSTRQSLLKVASKIKDVALEEEYNFSMLKCFQNESVFIGPKMRDTIKGWDMSTRFWFWANMYNYKGLFKANKEVRSAFSFLTWTIWCGPTLSKALLAVTIWVYVHLESEYSTLYNTTTSMKLPWDIGFSIMRMFCLLYLTPCIIFNDTDMVLKYYNSIFWIYHLILLILMIAAVVIYKSRS